MNISSVIVIPHPDQIEPVQRLLREVEGVEVHAVSPEGKIVVTLEAEDDRATSHIFNFVSHMDGVLSAAMVYHQNEPNPEALISLEA
ncbi:MAG: chaperone NapD [Gammaproteobacteria bacterium]|nr:glutamate synthase [Rhodocyclaceae bacterium]MBU3909283.1 chaperone NapD [Gammaproteobacteria bacterium]MBU3989523.1 chaperone NapD [Gammaproteobacteria bacterium]MBU4005557.1 chaperone NapD [Gammaproteobacteria bacterium]MBU4020890.1 chaperone NapD [Gammaproteobacteria bacterium]